MSHFPQKPRRGRGGPYRGTRGRGRAGSRRGSNFRTSRVDERRDSRESSDSIHEERKTGFDDRHSVDGITSETSESGDEEREASNSYGQLLQSLNFQPQVTAPPRKKRRLLNEPGTSLNTEAPPVRQDETTTKKQPSLDDSNNIGEFFDPSSEIQDSRDDGEALLDDAEDENQSDRDSDDTFVSHFASPDSDEVSKRLRSIQEMEWTSQSSTSLSGLKQYHSEPTKVLKKLHPVQSVNDLKIKSKYEKWLKELWDGLEAMERDIVAPIFAYQDILFGLRTVQNTSRLRDLLMLHALNHIFQTRTRVIKNNAKAAQDDAGDGPDHRDQGFARPKVLIILPTKQACVRFVTSLVKICEPEQQENKSRFTESFSPHDVEPWEDKPLDFQDLFGGNDDDMFRIGIKFTRKTIKFFSVFYQSDIILASPLGLRTAIETGGSKESKKDVSNADFLSSIEMVIVDHANALLMQNWLHVEFIFSQLNLLPKESHGCDFSRVRHWYLDGHAKYFRQTIVLTDFITPEINSIYTSNMLNWAGKVKYTQPYRGAMLDISTSTLTLAPNSITSITQTFTRLNSPTPSSDPDIRFATFTSTILPTLLKPTFSSSPSSSSPNANSGTLIFTPHHHDFIRLRNHLSSTSTSSFATISEYTSVPDVSRARSHFQSGRHSLLLYSERAHHFRRYRIRGVKRVVFYGVPENPVFWAEVVGFLGAGAGAGAGGSGGGGGGGGSSAAVRALFSRWDVLKLERIVGSDRVGRMVGDVTVDTFTFT